MRYRENASVALEIRARPELKTYLTKESVTFVGESVVTPCRDSFTIKFEHPPAFERNHLRPAVLLERYACINRLGITGIAERVVLKAHGFVLRFEGIVAA